MDSSGLGVVETLKNGMVDETRLNLDDSEIPLSLRFRARMVYEGPNKPIEKELSLFFRV